MGHNGADKIRVLVVDDSALMSRQITSILGEDSSIEVVGRAKDGLEALTMVKELQPDVVTMDVEMPRMNGITALKHIMVKHSVPTVMISALTKEGAKTTFDALKFGAIDVIAKPSRREDENLEAQKTDIISKVKRAAAIRTGRSRYIRMSASLARDEKISKGLPDSNTRFIAIGAGTGGYYGLLRIIPGLPAEFSDVLIAVILVASKYVEPFVSYLDAHSVIPVRTVSGPFIPERGACYVCSGDYLLGMENSHGALGVSAVQRTESEASINHFFNSLAETLSSRAIGVVMTGAGEDGAEGLASVRSAGGAAVVQDINNCMDPSMPIAALEKGTLAKVLPDYMMVDYLTKARAAEKN
ncbi:MAG: chemotaxis protein CheB [Desulfomonile tiedjei]|uniref:protein-glutamate methylesterase n=1 Tax=Desulfomonile tiedjei TaxID=2358 RepID=A0A9D6V133_9BACT|nr:chemotaxis protein CheB [Desulfomonile tiedjei]